MHVIESIHKTSETASETNSGEQFSAYYHLMTRGDGNETMSIYLGVSQIYTPHHSVHLYYLCITLQPPLLHDDVLDRACLRCTWRLRWSELRDTLGGRDQASLEMHCVSNCSSFGPGRFYRSAWQLPYPIKNR
jgi:hypothetical protein